MIRFIAIVAALSWLAGCQTQTAETGAGADAPEAPQRAGTPNGTGMAAGTETGMNTMKLSGSLIYRQRIALPVDAVAGISIWEEGASAPATEPLEEATFQLNGRQVPIPFEVELGADLGLKTDSLRLKAEILDGEGRLLWHNADDTVFTFAPGESDIGAVMLEPTSASVVDISELTGREWQVTRLNGQPVNSSPPPTINFGEDGHISGNASCNAYTGSFKVNAGKLTVAPLAMTRKGCVPPLMQQEQTLVSVLETVSAMRLDNSGELTLEAGDGGSITAR